jgi:prepilin-type N-terminal cleavage/methylation domain-containing protein
MINRQETESMKNEQGFSLIELLIVVAIIAIIAAIAVPSMLTARMAANESGAIQGCRTIGAAEVAYAASNNQSYASKAQLVTDKFLDSRFTGTTGFNGYKYEDGQTVTNATTFDATVASFLATPTSLNSSGRFKYGIGADQTVRYMGKVTGVTNEAKCGGDACAAGDPIGVSKATPAS